MSVVRVKAVLLETSAHPSGGGRVRVFTSATVEEFYNSHHSKTDGRFSSGGGGSTDWHRVGADSKYAKEKGLSLPVLPGKKAIAEIARQEVYRKQRKELESHPVESNAPSDAPTYKGQAAVRRAISKASNKYGQSGAFEFTLKDGTRTEIGVQRTTATHVYGKGGFGDYRIAFKDIASAKPLGIADKHAASLRGHLPFKAPTGPHVRHTVRKHSTPNFIDTNGVRHIKNIDDWTKRGAVGNRHPTGVTGHTKVKVKKGLFK